MRRSVVLALSTLSAFAVVPALVCALPASAGSPATPASITSVTARPGPHVGEITLSWRQNGSHTTGYLLETALTSFSRTDSGMASSGRRSRLTAISASRRSITLTARQVSALGAGVASGNALYYRFYAVDHAYGKTVRRAYPYLQTVLPKPEAPKSSGTRLRVASFNIRTARATSDKRTWLQRAPDVAAEILSEAPGVVAIQELGPGRADGKTGTTNGTPRQTTSLETALNRKGGARYGLVRTTPYIAPGTPSATQGARILYDTSRYTLLTKCPENTGKHSYSPSCSIVLPKLSSDSEQARIRGAMAEFKDRKTGQRFWFASAHLDPRHSGNHAKEVKLDALRKSQAAAVAAKVAKFNTAGVPVVIGGDFNSWQNNKVGNSAHDKLIGLGFYDTSAAVHRTHFQYTTFNGFKVTLPVGYQGLGVRLDMLFVKGARGARTYTNVMKVSDHSRPSDHNMIVSDIVL